MKEFTTQEIKEKAKEAISRRNNFMLGKMLYANDERIRDITLETVIEELFNYVKKAEQGEAK